MRKRMKKRVTDAVTWMRTDKSVGSGQRHKRPFTRQRKVATTTHPSLVLLHNTHARTHAAHNPWLRPSQRCRIIPASGSA